MKVLVLLSLVAFSAGSAIPSSRQVWAEESGILRFVGQNGREIDVFQSSINPGKVDVVVKKPSAPARILQIDNAGEGQFPQVGLLAEIIRQQQGFVNQQSYSSALGEIQNLIQQGAVHPSIYQVLRNLEAEELRAFDQVQQESPARRFQWILQSINRQPQYQSLPWKQQQGPFQRFARNQQGLQYNPVFEKQQRLQQIQLESVPVQQQLQRLEQGAQQIQQLQREIQQLQQLEGYQQAIQQQPRKFQQAQQQQQLQKLVQQVQQQQQLEKLVQQVQQQQQLQKLVQQVQQQLVNEEGIEQRQENEQLQRIGAQEWQQAEKLGQEAQQLQRIGAQEWQQAEKLGQEAQQLQRIGGQEWQQAEKLGQEVQQLREIENAEQQIVQGVPQYWRGRSGFPALFQRGQRFPQQQFGF